MTTPQTLPGTTRGALLDGYAGLEHPTSHPGSARPWDEALATLDGRPGNASLSAAIEGLGASGLQEAQRHIHRLVRSEGVTYGGTIPGTPSRLWHLDALPLVIEADDWAHLEAGIEQRSRLMDALYVDFYGRRRTITDRLVPAEVVIGHRGFLPAADQVRLPGKRQLVMTALDLARTPDGAWTVLSDRVQAPSGAGYAMANRRIVAATLGALHRNTDLRRLRGFFDAMQWALQEAARPAGDLPHVVLLSAGPGSESAYDQAMLSTLLGYPLAQSDDLVMRGGRLWLRTTGQLAAVDVILRRIDADWCDQLDLRPDSRLGVPGLVAASARGNLGVVNPLGAGVLENPGLVPHLDRLCRSLLGEPLLLPTAQTWWCGEDSSRQHVLAHLDDLVIKPIARGTGPRSILGWKLSAAQRDELRAEIAAEPWRWTAQEPVTPSTAPVITPTGLAPRNMVLRTFGVALDGDYHVMPGGLARVASEAGELVVTNSSGALAKDVWVLDAADTTTRRLDAALLARTRITAADAPLPGLTPRSASNLFWLGRHGERAEASTRLLLVTDNLVEDHLRHPRTAGHAAMREMLHATAAVTTVHCETGARERWQEQPFTELRGLLTGASTPGTIVHSVNALAGMANEVRELLSVDTSVILAGMLSELGHAGDQADGTRMSGIAHRVVEGCLALSGLTGESLVRDEIWAFLDAGRRIERAQGTVRLLRNTIAVLARDGGPSRVAQQLVVESVLRAGDSLLTHRRRMAAGVGFRDPAASALHLLLTDESNPRSVIAQMQRFGTCMALAPSVPIQAETRAIIAELRSLDVNELCEGHRVELGELLGQLETRLRALADMVERTHFVHQAPQHSFAQMDFAQSGDDTHQQENKR